jgi:hypothetical protein
MVCITALDVNDALELARKGGGARMGYSPVPSHVFPHKHACAQAESFEAAHARHSRSIWSGHHHHALRIASVYHTFIGGKISQPA